MTLRLVGLISIVLLLSLAAFGLLMGYYQDQVMQEVARTASAVGKATLRTLEFGEPASSGSWEDEATWVAADGSESTVERHIVHRRFDSKGPDADPNATKGTIMLRKIRRTPAGAVVEEVITGEFDSPCGADDGSEPPCPTETFVCPEGVSDALCVELRAGIEAGAASLDDSLPRRGEELEAQLFVDLQRVRVDRRPADGTLVLHIPTMTPAHGAHGPGPQVYGFRTAGQAPSTSSGQAPSTDSGQGENEFMLADGGVIRLPIAVDDYDELFQSIRGRSLFLFLGVFVVGMVLSTGLASRFTKPIRRLDSGIRRLSAGDLEVQVEVNGKDEIARLGMAFNDMAHKLKESRDRSREMVRREKLSALGGLAAGVAHDVRNPLHSIGLTLQHLRETCRPEGDARAAEFDHSMDIIRGEIRRLDQLVTSFLSFSRSERHERQPVDMADLLQETARLIQKEAEWRGIEVQLDAGTVTPTVSADAESIRASILNLVLNSFNAMPDGGRLTLALRVQHDSLVVEVTDNGRGIPEDEQEKVFEFAYSTREGGSGLGLAMVHQCIVEDHGGKVSIDSTPDEGTTVRLALPIRTPERSATPGSPGRGPA